MTKTPNAHLPRDKFASAQSRFARILRPPACYDTHLLPKPRIGLGDGGTSLYGEVYRTRECSAAVPSLHRDAVRPKRKVSRIVHILGRGVKPHYPVYIDLQLAEGQRSGCAGHDMYGVIEAGTIL